MPFTEDLTDFIDTDDFADTATINGADVDGIFERQYATVNGQDALKPTFYCSLSDVSGVAKDDGLSVNSADYVVHGIEKEEPFCLVILHDA